MHWTKIACAVTRARWSVAALALFAALGAAAPGAAWSQDGAAADPPAAAQPAPKFRGRLPAYYSRVVSETQRLEIYKIQGRFAEQLAELEAQIREIESQRDDEVRDVLTPEQKKQVDQMVAAAKARRAARAAPSPEPPAGGEPAKSDDT